MILKTARKGKVGRICYLEFLVGAVSAAGRRIITVSAL